MGIQNGYSISVPLVGSPKNEVTTQKVVLNAQLKKHDGQRICHLKSQLIVKEEISRSYGSGPGETQKTVSINNTISNNSDGDWVSDPEFDWGSDTADECSDEGMDEWLPIIQYEPKSLDWIIETSLPLKLKPQYKTGVMKLMLNCIQKFN